MEYAKICLMLCICVVLCRAEPEQLELEESKALPADLLAAVDNAQADASPDAVAPVEQGARKVRQYFGPPPPPFFGPPPPPYFGGFGGGYGGGYGGYGFGGGYQRTRIVTRTRVRGGYGGFGGGFGGFGGGGGYYG
ncbi:shematrin-like protein 2 [Drosophila montana]|uniref:shematrin-like protein 2 n=1 Tax=Drosophila montana TaxID=40370 RepID=UPI00313D92B7